MEKHEQQPKLSFRNAIENGAELYNYFNRFHKVLEFVLFKEKNYVQQLKSHHKIIFAFLVFFAINLLWYGMWGVISRIPFLNNPLAAIFFGAIILIATGYFYENLISTHFGKTNGEPTGEQDT